MVGRIGVLGVEERPTELSAQGDPLEKLDTRKNPMIRPIFPEWTAF